MRVICITREVMHSNGGLTYAGITVGKTYEASYDEDKTFEEDGYFIIDDFGERNRFETVNFMHITELW